MLHFELGPSGFAELNLQVQRKCGIALYGRVFVEPMVELKTLGHKTMHRAAKCACSYLIWQTLVALLCCVYATLVFSKLCWTWDKTMKLVHMNHKQVLI